MRSLSIVIPSLARPNLRVLLYKLLAQIEAGDEIIVVFDLVNYPRGLPSGIKILSTAGKNNQAAAKNLGAKNATSGILLFLEDDELPAKDLIYQVKRFWHENHEACLMAGRIRPAKPGKKSLLKDVLLNLPLWPLAEIIKAKKSFFGGGLTLAWGRSEANFNSRRSSACDWAGAGCLSIKLRDFTRLNGFDEKLLAGCHFEEADLALRLKELYRLKNQKAKIIYHPKALVYHLAAGKNSQNFLNLRANEVYVSLKNLRLTAPNLILFLIYHLWQSLVYLILSLFKKSYFDRLQGKSLGLKYYLKNQPKKIYIDVRVLKKTHQTGKEKYLRFILPNLTLASRTKIILLKNHLLVIALKLIFAKIKQERFVFYSAISFILPSLTDFNNVIVIHDLASLKFPALNNLKAKIIERLCLAAACRQAKKIIVPSQSVRKELVNLMPELTTKTIVVAEG